MTEQFSYSERFNPRMTSTPTSIDDIRALLVRVIATEAAIPAEDVATDQPFTSYGIDSIAALSAGMEIEDHYGLSGLPADLLWDHPTVDTLAAALWQILRPEPEMSAPGGSDRVA
jgi:acyl carrier protein